MPLTRTSYTAAPAVAGAAATAGAAGAGFFVTGCRFERTGIVAIGEERGTDLRKQRVGQYVVDTILGETPAALASEFLDFGRLLLELRLQKVGRAHRHRFRAPSRTFACNSLLTGVGVAPYSPFKMPAASLVIVW